ncbi:organic solvent ABC transporter [Stenotrophomonas sp. ATCM1_4]|jgi:phospholipid transport system substrate-binding protein|uniref:ABC transporter substrate-binding protein n=1 Tax=Stenotrophomonas capsici TaxID=3110230 RepID=A0ABU5V1D1_9GAMM|nr:MULTISPECIES: ABC transporter substrate-binding protein [unclassified Stenotrophomonas]MEA5667164.1 ABC transporter substrate-binding protein [Stenotrophomonas sp. MH1]TDB27673.1 organic solvent ABC transporter [Stenotrophomonas sp. ATCM1_4]
MNVKLLGAVLASALLASTPALVSAQARPAATAAQPSPAARTVLDSSTRIIDTLQSRRSEFRSNPAALRSFIDGELSRGFDRDYAARLVLGVHGRGASDEDVKLFADAMADNLMSRYGSTLLDIQGKPSFRYKGETALPGNRGVKVTTELVRSGSEPTPVEYLMRNVGGQWKIFDVMIEGISYVQTFKNQFDAPLRQKSIRQVATELRSGSIQANAGPAPRGK